MISDKKKFTYAEEFAISLGIPIICNKDALNTIANIAGFIVFDSNYQHYWTYTNDKRWRTCYVVPSNPKNQIEKLFLFKDTEEQQINNSKADKIIWVYLTHNGIKLDKKELNQNDKLLS